MRKAEKGQENEDASSDNSAWQYAMIGNGRSQIWIFDGGGRQVRDEIMGGISGRL